jgi:cell division transport system permease protein
MRPLLGSALKQGVWAGVVSGLLIAFTVYGVEAFTPQGIAMLDHIAVGIIIGSTLTVGVVITLLYTAAAVNKFVNMKTNKIYLY